MPFFVIDRTYGLPGAQHPDVLVDVLRQAWNEGNPVSASGATPPAGAEDVCEGENCAV